MSMKIKRGDTVKVIAGKDCNAEGKVISVDVKKNRVLVEGVNMVTKHGTPTQSLLRQIPTEASSRRKLLLISLT